MKKAMTLAAIAAMALVSCKREAGPGHAESGGAISFSTSAVTVSSTRGPVLGTSLAGETIGIFAVNNRNNSPAWGETPYVMDDLEGQVTGTKVNYGTEKPYPTDGTTLNFYAYYPFAATATNNSASNAAPTVAVAEGGETDYMWAAETNSGAGYTVRPGSVMLTFNHAMSLVRVRVQKRNNVTDALTISEMSLTTTSVQSGTMNLSNGDITTGSGTGATYTKTGLTIDVPAQAGTGSTPANTDISAAADVHSYMFVPGSSLSNIEFVTADGQTFSAALSITSLVRGQAIELVATISEQNVVFSVKLIDWDDHGAPVYLSDHSVQSDIQVGGQDWSDGATTPVE